MNRRKQQEIPNPPMVCVLNNAGRSRYINYLKYPNRRNIVTPDFDLQYVLGGRGVLIIDGTRYELEQDDVIIVYPGERFTAVYDSKDFYRFFFHFNCFDKDGKPLSAKAVRAIYGKRVFKAKNHTVSSMMCLRIINETLSDDSYTKCMATAYFNELLATLLRQRCGPAIDTQFDAGIRKHRAELDAAKEYIDRNFARPLPVKMILGKQSGLNTTYFSKLFAGYTGCTPYSYIVKKRMEYAKLLLIEHRQPIKKIAEMCGYTDVQQFSKMFKKVAGKSPGAFSQQFERDAEVGYNAKPA